MDSKLKIALITGGDVAEREISLKSAATVRRHLDPDKYEVRTLELRGRDFHDLDSGARVDKNDFTLPLEGQRLEFDLAFLMLHGHPAEDGCLQGYLQIMGLPFTGCDAFVSALTFNKQACKHYLAPFDVPMAPSLLLRKGEAIDWDCLQDMELPLFVKPNKNGSSYGVSKVLFADELEPAVERAFEYDDEVLVEGFLEGVEYSCGVLRENGRVVALPITEIRPFTEFFDYQAKYENQSEEITPAPLDKPLAEKCAGLSRRLYEALHCKGVVRFDYILVGDTFHFLEANTIPGMTEQSIVPQQARAHGWTLSYLFDLLVQEGLRG